MTGVSYKDSGVDLDVYNEAMKRLPRLMHRTFSPRVRQLDGGFAGLFQLDFSNKLFRRNYEDPMLVACTDGCLLYTSPSPRDRTRSRMPSSA